MTQELFKMCKDLSLQDKVELRDFLDATIKSDKGGVGKTGLRCLDLMEEIRKVMGLERVSMESRIPIHVWARTMVAYQMIREGYTTPEIGEQMGRTPSAIHHLKEKMRDAMDYPMMYGDVLEIWNKFQNTIHNDIH